MDGKAKVALVSFSGTRTTRIVPESSDGTIPGRLRMGHRLFRMRAPKGLVRGNALPTYEEVADDGGDYRAVSTPGPFSQWAMEEEAMAAILKRR